MNGKVHSSIRHYYKSYMKLYITCNQAYIAEVLSLPSLYIRLIQYSRKPGTEPYPMLSLTIE